MLPLRFSDREKRVGILPFYSYLYSTIRKKTMNQKERRIATTRAFKAELIKSQGPDFSFDEDDVMLIFDFRKPDGEIIQGLEYHRGQNEVYNPIMKWAEGHGDNTNYYKNEEVVGSLNQMLEEIKAVE
jgi:hypothetical protein